MYTTYPQNNTYALQYNGYAPMQQPIPVQPMPMADEACAAGAAIGIGWTGIGCCIGA